MLSIYQNVTQYLDHFDRLYIVMDQYNDNSIEKNFLTLQTCGHMKLFFKEH